jgi:IS5 family transposase
MDSDSELITMLKTTRSNANDGKEFSRMVDTKAKTVTADKAYDSKRNHSLLKKKRITSAIIIKRNRKSHRLKSCFPYQELIH